VSFRCAECGEVAKHGRLVVRETREKDYTEVRTVGLRTMVVPVGSGFETVREERVCTDCLEKKAVKVPGYAAA
jgi:hypothetical protein